MVRDDASATAIDCDRNSDGWQRLVRWQLVGDGWHGATAIDGLTAT